MPETIFRPVDEALDVLPVSPDQKELKDRQDRQKFEEHRPGASKVRKAEQDPAKEQKDRCTDARKRHVSRQEREREEQGQSDERIEPVPRERIAAGRRDALAALEFQVERIIVAQNHPERRVHEINEAEIVVPEDHADRKARNEGLQRVKKENDERGLDAVCP